jgi:cysteine-rich repeat protein
MIERATRRVETFRPIATRRILRGCDASTFTAAYGRHPDVYADRMTQLAGCIASAFYVQDRVPCPAPVCGNRIVESTEECDDGNAEPGDGCDTECTRE